MAGSNASYWAGAFTEAPVSIGLVKRKLRELSYMEMKALGVQIWDGLNGAEPDPSYVSEILATLPDEDPEELEREKALLEDRFSRKRNITITPYHDGAWQISMTNGPTILTADVREGLSEFLDSLVALRALEK